MKGSIAKKHEGREQEVHKRHQEQNRRGDEKNAGDAGLTWGDRRTDKEVKKQALYTLE